MKRTLVALDDETHAALRKLSYEQGRSMASLVRETLSRSFGARKPGRPASLKDYPFVASGSSRQRKGSAVSELHDEAFAEALRPETGARPSVKRRRG